MKQSVGLVFARKWDLFKVNHERPHSVRQSSHFIGRIPAPAVSHLQSLHLWVSGTCSVVVGRTSAQQLSPWMTLSKRFSYFWPFLAKWICWIILSARFLFLWSIKLVVNFEVLSSEKKWSYMQESEVKETCQMHIALCSLRQPFYSSQFLASCAWYLILWWLR